MMRFILILCSFATVLLKCPRANGLASVPPIGTSHSNLPPLSLQKNDASTKAKGKGETQRSIALSQNILHSLRRRTQSSSSSPSSSSSLLNLETDFYDPTTGLHSEGVWHNCLVGMASVKLAELQQFDKNNAGQEEEEGEAQLSGALRIANSLWEHSWDGISFQRRSWSGQWDHSRLLEGASQDPPEQANYYRESTEHRCIQHGAALLFWSKLIRHQGIVPLRDDDDDDGEQEIHYRCRAQYKLITKQFLNEYWDDVAKKWRTVGSSQGGGTASRESASAGASRAGVVDNEAPYYRAVDQAIGLLACLEIIMNDDNENEFIGDIVRATCQTLLTDFGYQNDKETVSYIGLKRNRNLWHDGWVALALVSCAQIRSDCFPMKMNGKREVGLLLDRLQDAYRDEKSGTMWHWQKAQKTGHENGNVRYCGDNALWYAISRQWRQGSSSCADEDDTFNSFWEFVNELRTNQEDGLVSVADVYPQVRLHPNTELAFLVLWPI